MINKCQSTFLSRAPRYPKDRYFEGSLPDWPNNRSIQVMCMVLVEWWQETRSTRRKKCQFVHHKSHLDWSGIEPAPPRGVSMYIPHAESLFFV